MWIGYTITGITWRGKYDGVWCDGVCYGGIYCIVAGYIMTGYIKTGYSVAGDGCMAEYIMTGILW